MSRRARFAVGLYIGIGISTFGYAAESQRKVIEASVRACEAQHPTPWVCAGNDLRAPTAGMAAAALWPLYWSWQAWS